MYRRTLPRDAVLWWRGNPADSVGVVERGKVGIRGPEGLLDIALPTTALGESALLTPEGAVGKRTADLVALENDTVVLECPVSVLRETADFGTHRLILRTLVGQTCRNAVFVLASQAEQPLVQSCLWGLLGSLGGCERAVSGVASWDTFLASFHVLHALREASDQMRRHLGLRGRCEIQALGPVLAKARSLLDTAHAIPYLEQLLRAEQELQSLTTH